jgi:hypothetical protein
MGGRASLCCALSAAALLASAGPAQGQAGGALGRAQAAIRHLESLERFRFDATTVFDVAQESGQTLQFSDHRIVTVRRPDRIRASWADDHGGSHELYYDGRTLTRHDKGHEVYGQLDVPATIDETLDYLELGLGATFPLADLLYADLSHLARAARETRVVGTAYVAGVDCDHLAFRGEALDWQLWIEQGATPWIRKIAIDYKRVRGAPRFSAFFTAWEAAPQAGDALFHFSPPRRTRKIPTLALPARGEPEEIESRGEFR